MARKTSTKTIGLIVLLVGLLMVASSFFILHIGYLSTIGMVATILGIVVLAFGMKGNLKWILLIIAAALAIFITYAMYLVTTA